MRLYKTISIKQFVRPSVPVTLVIPIAQSITTIGLHAPAPLPHLLCPRLFFLQEWLLRFTHTRTTLAQAKRVLLTDSWGRFFVQKVLLVKKGGTSVTK